MQITKKTGYSFNKLSSGRIEFYESEKFRKSLGIYIYNL